MTNSKNSHDHGIDRYHEMDAKTDRVEQLKTIYADWAEDYDHDNDHKLGTVSQPNAVALLTRHLADHDAKILDFGCGTGLVGHHLRQAGFHNYTGTDLSAEMLEQAAKRGYGELIQSNAEQGLPFSDNSFDAVMCVGVFTHGHVKPEGLDEVIRVTKPGGIICFTVNEGVWQKDGFDQVVAQKSASGEWQELEIVKQAYMVNEGVEAWYVAARKT